MYEEAITLVLASLLVGYSINLIIVETINPSNLTDFRLFSSGKL